ncbi:NUDIX domain-containing protein [Sphingomonas sp. HF-S3]|uniref:NUDIX domain-containing protein n=1 Tax=Sphingomonas rustica TaxID=3103142 RepID=A0ABV0BEA5_9SPHN
MSGDTPVQPRVGCGAAILRDGQLLLVRRLRAPEAGHWGLAGGKVDPFETVPQAVEREIAEELGIAIRADRLLCVVDLIDRDAGFHWVSPVYRVDTFEGEPEVREPHTMGELGWFALDALPHPLTASALAAVAAITKA